MEQAGSDALRIIEIGCGKGEFIRSLLLAVRRARVWGSIPATSARIPRWKAVSASSEGSTTPRAAASKRQVVVCRHVIEHVASRWHFCG